MDACRRPSRTRARTHQTAPLRTGQLGCAIPSRCASVCPSAALRFDHGSQRLVFSSSRCLVCEQCIPSCPLEAIALLLEPETEPR